MKNFFILFHGGEPLLFGKARFGALCAKLRSLAAECGIDLRLAVTTNAVLIDADWAALFSRWRVGVTVSLDDRRGLVTVRDEKGSTFGTIHVHDRKVASVRCGALRGREAFYEILIAQPDRGSFTFSIAGPAADGAEQLDLRPLLLESMRLEDEFNRFRKVMPGDALLRVVSRQLQWRGEGNPELAARIWEELSAEPSGWRQLVDRLAASRAQVALAVRQMLLDGSIESDRPLDLREVFDLPVDS